jgi:hypothetical protein
MPFLLLAVFFAPLTGFVAGFLAGILRPVLLRIIAAIIVIVSPLACLSMPLLLPGTSADSRYGAAFFLTVFAAHIALWMLFGTLGVFVGVARGRHAG